MPVHLAFTYVDIHTDIGAICSTQAQASSRSAYGSAICMYIYVSVSHMPIRTGFDSLRIINPAAAGDEHVVYHPFQAIPRYVVTLGLSPVPANSRSSAPAKTLGASASVNESVVSGSPARRNKSQKSPGGQAQGGGGTGTYRWGKTSSAA